MAKFEIPTVKPKTYITVRFPNDVVERVKETISGRECNFSAFVVAAVQNALEELEEEPKNNR